MTMKMRAPPRGRATATTGVAAHLVGRVAGLANLDEQAFGARVSVCAFNITRVALERVRGSTSGSWRPKVRSQTGFSARLESPSGVARDEADIPARR